MWLSNKLSLGFFTQEVFLSLEKAFGLNWENGEEPTGRASKWIWPKFRRWEWKSRETGSSCWTVIAVLCCCCFAGSVILNEIDIFSILFIKWECQVLKVQDFITVNFEVSTSDQSNNKIVKIDKLKNYGPSPSTLRNAITTKITFSRFESTWKNRRPIFYRISMKMSSKTSTKFDETSTTSKCFTGGFFSRFGPTTKRRRKVGWEIWSKKTNDWVEKYSRRSK